MIGSETDVTTDGIDVKDAKGSSQGVRGNRASSSLLVSPLRVHGAYLSLGCPFGSTSSSWSLWVSMLFNMHIVMLCQCLDG